MNNSFTQRKICILGDFSVGKTSLTRRFVVGVFSDQYLSTIGVKISRRIVNNIGDKKVNFIIWDVAGSEEFNGKQTSYLQGASGALLVCDLTRKSTLSSLRQYEKAIRRIEPEVRLVVIANKNDLTDQFEMDPGEVISFAREVQSTCFVTSAKTGEHVEEAFTQLATEIETT